MEFFKKALPLIIVAIIFAVGGYFIGRGALQSQGAALYKAANTLNTIQPGGTKTPCDYSPTNPCVQSTQSATTTCPDGTCGKPMVNNHCPQGTQFMNGKCVPSNATALAALQANSNWGPASINIRQVLCEVWYSGAGLTPAQAKAECAKVIAISTSSAKN